MSTTKDNLLSIMQITREMLGKAEAGAWDDLIILESRRGSMITQYFETFPDIGVDAGDAVCLYELRELSNRILELGKVQRQQLMKVLSEGNRQRLAASSYRQTRTG